MVFHFFWHRRKEFIKYYIRLSLNFYNVSFVKSAAVKKLIYIVVFICYKLAKYESKNFSQCIKNIRVFFFLRIKYMTAFSSVSLILTVGA